MNDNSNVVEFLLQQQEQILATRTIVERRSNSISFFRIAAFLVVLGAGFFGLTQTFYFGVAGLALLAFVFLLRESQQLQDQLAFLKALASGVANELARQQYELDALDPGSEFQSIDHPYAHDLDLFSTGGLFAWLNRSASYSGKSHLARRMTQLPTDIQQILRDQQAVQELATKPEFLLEAVALAALMKEAPHDRHQLTQWIQEKSAVSELPAWIFTLLPVTTVLFGIISFFSPWFQVVFYLLVLSQWLLRQRYSGEISLFHERVSRVSEMLRKAAKLTKHWSQQTFTSAVNREIASKATAAQSGLKNLAELVTLLNARLNFMTSAIVNSLLLYDVRCIYRLDKWRSVNRAEMPGWLESMDYSETVVSLALCSWSNPAFSFPTFAAGRHLQAEELAHPLIPPGLRVANDVQFGGAEAVIIITGPNMAGKSTFLRTLGVNYVLGRIGGVVCARQYAAGVMELRSGMRTTDSLSSHASYFYAELRRLEGILQELRNGVSLFVLLDEMLKGTNSTDKLQGSIGLVNQLLHYQCLAIIATHDLALGNMENDFPDKVRNYCFEADFLESGLAFNYRLLPGIATKMNAVFLMKKMGILP